MLPVAMVHWPLRLVFGDVAALNLISLGAWVLSSWCTYRLARRFVAHWGAAFVATLAYTYAVVRLVHQLHFQLVIGGALVPLVLLLLLRLLDAPTYRRGIELGLGFATLTLTASYFGAMMAIVVAIVCAGWLVTLPRGERRRSLVSLAAAAGVIAVLVLPIGVQYLRLQQHPEFRRGFDPVAGAHLDDFLAAGPTSYVLGHVPQIAPRSHSGRRTIENRLFPGVIALVFGIVGAVVLVREARRRGLRRGRTRALMLVSVAGATCLVLSFGDWFRFRGHRVFLPFVVFRHLVPGFAGIRAVSRLALAAELALVLCAAVGIDALLARWRGPVRVLVALALAGLVCAEAALGLFFVRVPTSRDDGGVDVALRARPHGVVVELPISGITRGVVWPFVEAPRRIPRPARRQSPRKRILGLRAQGLRRGDRHTRHVPVGSRTRGSAAARRPVRGAPHQPRRDAHPGQPHVDVDRRRCRALQRRNRAIDDRPPPRGHGAGSGSAPRGVPRRARQIVVIFA